ncbi:hypothetical protein [Xylanibacter rodentium]|jgi:hypothetical protein|uniref:hypothetical protein n=1 Tax=Xylanibacter rodentium TaxID=2736289 RepID=UPI0025583B01|nr:hypothetical protein [Xylanibacter rodentium]
MDTLWYGFLDTNKNGYPRGIRFECFWNPFDVVTGFKSGLEDDDCYQVAIAIADYYLLHRFDEFIEPSNKYL